MMLSFVCFSRIAYTIAEKEIKMLEMETLFMLVNAVLYKYVTRFSLYEYLKYFSENLIFLGLKSCRELLNTNNSKEGFISLEIFI